MGRLDNQKTATSTTGGRLPKTTTQPVAATKAPSQGNFITNAPSNIAALFRGDVGVGAVVKEMPGVALRGAVKTAETVAPALTNFTKTTGGIIGEGLAYATSKNVREQYKAGNLDILPNVTKTTQKGLLKDTAAAALEATIIRSVPKAMTGNLTTRAGIGGLEGIGFAISEGLAKDQTADEIIKNATTYGVSGAALNVALPWLGPLLQKEIGRAPATLKQALKEEAASVPNVISTPPSPPEVIKPPVGDTLPPPTASGVPTKPQTVAVQGEQLPIGGQTVGPSRLEARLVAQTEDPTYKAGVDNYAKYSKEADAPEITGSANVEQIKRASLAVENMPASQINDIVSGTAELPEGVLRTAFIKAATEKALLEGDSSLVNRLARAVGQLARRFGQEVQFTKNFDPLDPVTNLSDIISVRLKTAERRLPKGETVSNYTKRSVKEARSKVTTNQLKIQEAENLIDSILC